MKSTSTVIHQFSNQRRKGGCSSHTPPIRVHPPNLIPVSFLFSMSHQLQFTFRLLPHPMRPDSPPDATHTLSTQLLAYPPPDIRYFLQINRVSPIRRSSDVIRRLLKRVEYILSGDISCCTRGVRTSTKTTDRRVDGSNTVLEGSQGIDDACSICIMELEKTVNRATDPAQTTTHMSLGKSLSNVKDFKTRENALPTSPLKHPS